MNEHEHTAQKPAIGRMVFGISTRSKRWCCSAMALTQDPICGMTVDTGTALQVERDGKTAYFYSDPCRKKFLLTPVGAPRVWSWSGQWKKGLVSPQWIERVS